MGGGLDEEMQGCVSWENSDGGDGAGVEVEIREGEVRLQSRCEVSEVVVSKAGVEVKGGEVPEGGLQFGVCSG